MHELCCARDITGTARVRRYLMAIAHDLGKVPIADERGGLRSDDPPTRFSGHAAAGTEVVSDLVDRLGLPDHFEAAMRDAAALHMDFHDLPSEQPADIIRFVDNHTTAETAETPTFATVWELLDLAQADEQGRFQDRALYDNQDSAQCTEHPDAPDDAVQPVFDRDQYAAVIGAAHTAMIRPIASGRYAPGCVGRIRIPISTMRTYRRRSGRVRTVERPTRGSPTN